MVNVAPISNDGSWWVAMRGWSRRSDDLKWGWRPLIPGNLWIDGRCAVSVRICLNKHSDVNKNSVRPSVLCSPSFHRHHLPRRCRRAILSRCRRRVVLALPGLIPPPKNGRPHLPCPLRSRRIRSQIPYPYPFPPRTYSLLALTSSHTHCAIAPPAGYFALHPKLFAGRKLLLPSPRMANRRSCKTLPTTRQRLNLRPHRPPTRTSR